MRSQPLFSHPLGVFGKGTLCPPYLFLICTEGSNALIHDAASKKELHGISVCRSAPVTHLFFADDSLLFMHANLPEAQRVLDILNIYEAASGEMVNVDKLKVSYSQNVSDNMQHMLQRRLGFKAVKTHVCYAIF